MDSQPSISVVTACYNCHRYIGDTIRSVTEQGYPNLQYIVADGASTDGTMEVIRSCADKIDVVISEPDSGQYHAIQKGFDRAHGEILAWLNADDMYFPWTLKLVGKLFRQFPDVQWITGLPAYLNEDGDCVKVSDVVSAYPRRYLHNGWFRRHLGPYVQQESTFWRRSLWEVAGGLDLTLDYAADFELWTRFARHGELVTVATPLAGFRRRAGRQKSSAGRDIYEREVANVCGKLARPPVIWNALARRSMALRCLCRLAIWKKCRVIAYSTRQDRWVMKTLRRPLSRSAMTGMLLEKALRANREQDDQ